MKRMINQIRNHHLVDSVSQNNVRVKYITPKDSILGLVLTIAQKCELGERINCLGIAILGDQGWFLSQNTFEGPLCCFTEAGELEFISKLSLV